VDFREDRKERKEKERENSFCGCLVGKMRGGKTGWAQGIFLPSPSKFDLSIAFSLQTFYCYI